MKCLDDLEMNTIGYINKINTNEQLYIRLLDLGSISNTPIKPGWINPTNDSRAYEIRGSLIAIRKSDAERIIIN